MESYPKKLIEFERMFTTDADCVKYLAAIKWPAGFHCPVCGATRGWQAQGGLMACAGCRRRISVKTGTIFQDTRTPLPVWFRAAWWTVGQKNGCSAKGLQKSLGLGSYETAWTMLHKLRRAMVLPGRKPLTGLVEVDETYLGGHRPGVRGRGAESKVPVMVAVEDKGDEGFGRIRLEAVPDASSESLHGFIRRNIEAGSRIRTDGWVSYVGAKAFRHEPVTKDLKLAHRVAALLKRWLGGTHQGAVAHDHLQSYLDEFVFRFNRRTSRYRGLLFRRLIENAVRTSPAPYKSIIKPRKKHKR
jgi:transposase-like protein